MTMFKQRLAYTNTLSEKKSYKRVLIGPPSSSSSLKIIFAPLKDMVVVQVQFNLIYLRYLNFKESPILY